MNPDIEKALTLTLEIEGLLHLLEHRNLNDMPQTVKKLLKDKSAELAALFSSITVSQEKHEENIPAAVAESLPVDKNVDDTVGQQLESFEAVNLRPDNDDTSMPEPDDERIAETVAYEQEEDSQPQAGAPDAYTTRLDIAQAEEDEADMEDAEIEAARHNYYGEIAQKRSAGAQLAQRFTLNDRYRFTRELFGGSNTAFNVILDEISTFSDLEEVRRYLSDRQGIDTSVGAGKDFLAIISKAF